MRSDVGDIARLVARSSRRDDDADFYGDDGRRLRRGNGGRSAGFGPVTVFTCRALLAMAVMLLVLFGFFSIGRAMGYIAPSPVVGPSLEALGPLSPLLQPLSDHVAEYLVWVRVFMSNLMGGGAA